MLLYRHLSERAVSFSGAEVLKVRMQRASFRQELSPLLAMFTLYHTHEVPLPPTKALHLDRGLTDQFQRLLRSELGDDERLAFQVVTLPDTHAGSPWVGVRYAPSAHTAELLVIASPDGKLLQRWSELPAAVAAQFMTGPRGASNDIHWLSQPMLQLDHPPPR